MTANMDVAVVGGGPAGAVTAGLLASTGVSVALIEKTAYETWRIGESLPPAFLALVRQLQLERAVSDKCYVRCPGIVSVWGSSVPFEQDFIRMPYGYGLRVDRTTFDRSLADWAASRGAAVWKHTSVATVGFTESSWSLGLKGSLYSEIKVRFVVDASGRNCFPLGGVLRHQFADRLVALAAVCRKPPCLDQRTLIESVPDGWWYSALLPTGQMLVSFFTDSDLLNRGRNDLQPYLRNAPVTAERVGFSTLERPRLHNASSRLRADIAGRAWMAVGDSASSFDPISGQGICKALSQAAEAAPAVLEALDGNPLPLRAYENTVRAAFDQYVRQRNGYYEAESRWRDLPFWKRRMLGATQPEGHTCEL